MDESDQPAGTAFPDQDRRGVAAAAQDSDNIPPPGLAAYDYYSAQSDQLQGMMRNREARMSRVVPHIIIKGQQQQPLPSINSAGHTGYNVQVSEASQGEPYSHNDRDSLHRGAQPFDSALEHDDEFLNSFQLPPLQVPGAINTGHVHMGSDPPSGFANMPLHMVDRDFESLPAELPSHVMDRLLGESAAAPAASAQPQQRPPPSPSPGAGALGRPMLARTFSAPSVADLDWDPASAMHREDDRHAPQQQHHQQQQVQQQQTRPRQQNRPEQQHRYEPQQTGHFRARQPHQPSAMSEAITGFARQHHGAGGHRRHAAQEDEGAAPPARERRNAQQERQPEQLLMGCSAELREFAAHADIDELHKVYLTPAEKRKGKGGRQPASDPRLDPSVDPKKARRILANRLSAARSKLKQRSQMDDFQKQIDSLESQKDRLQDEVASLQAACNEHVQMNSQLGQRISVVQQHCHAQDREHAQLADVHRQLGLALPPGTNIPSPVLQSMAGLPHIPPAPKPPQVAPPPALSTAAAPAPAHPGVSMPIPLRVYSPGQLSAHLPVAPPQQQPSQQQQAQQQQAQQALLQAPPGSQQDMQARNRLVQELQRFDLPPELRQMLQNIPAASGGPRTQ